MRETERERMEKRMILRARWRERRTNRTRDRHLRRRREENLIKRMASVDLNPLGLTLYILQNSSRVSIDPHSRTILTFAEHGVNEGAEILKSLEEFSHCIQSRWMKGVEAEIRETALKLEDVLDSHVLDQFLSQSEAQSMQLAGDERRPLCFSLSLEGIQQNIDGFVEKMMEIEKLLNPWSEESGGGGEWSNVFGLSDRSPRTWFMSWSAYEATSIFLEMHEEDSNLFDQFEVKVTRTWFISWFATKAASIFLGMKEDYIQELEKLLPEDEENDDYAYLFISGFSRSNLVSSSKIRDELTIWWIGKAASVFVKDEELEEQLDNPLSLPEEDDDVSSSAGYPLDMVGFTDMYSKIRDQLMKENIGYGMFSIVGMAGIGKTTLANKILQDPLISSKFECRVLVRLGPKYHPEEIMQSIAAQMTDGDKMGEDKAYLIVFDDVWDQDYWRLDREIRSHYGTKGWILLTTRINHVSYSDGMIYKVPFLNKEESWDLLRRKIFGEKRCSHELEKAGRQIAENCEGLPLLIITVAGILSKAEMTTEHWNQVAANKTNSTFVEAYEQILKVVYPSYSNLPQHLKACFLYLGAFPQNDEMRVSKLTRLWSADGFLGLSYTDLCRYADRLLSEMLSNNVVLETQTSCTLDKLKACSLHSVFWYLCKREAWNEKFLLVLNSCTDVATAEGIKSARRLSIYKNIIFSIKEVRDSIASMSTLRSLLCTGPYHQYQVPMLFGLRLLRLLDAITIRFYEFPVEVFKLLHLNFLAITCNANLPPSVSILWNLQTLILHQHLSIKSSASQSYLPVEIWDLQKLEHLQIMGRNLPDPPPGAILRNLLILLDVGADTCTERVLGSIPNLRKLRVQIELMPSVSAKSLRFCDDLSHLRGLVSLQFVVVNPTLMLETFAPAPVVSASSIRKLTLSGLGYPWEEMKEIAKLPYLNVLKLKCYAFRGEKWEVKEEEFSSLVYILIEDTDLVQWTGVLHLSYLTIKHCYRLQEIPQLSSYTKEIRVVDCSPSAVTCAEQMAPDECSVYVDSSWLVDDKLS